MNAPAAYYRFIEAKIYDDSLAVMREKRDFRTTFLNRISELLAYEHDEFARSLIQDELGKRVHAIPESNSRVLGATIFQRARTASADGVKLLNVSEPLTAETLRRAYRLAVKKYHPDVGGDTHKMCQVNDSYALFMALVEEDAPVRSTQAIPFGLPTDSVDDVFRNSRVERFSAELDDLAVDRAFKTYTEVGPLVFDGVYHGVELIAKLCELLAAAHRPKDAELVLADLEHSVDRAQGRGLTYSSFLEHARAAIAAPETIRIIPNHMRQADNLLRIGVIDERRYASVMARMSRNEQHLDQARDEFLEALRGLSFLVLPMDPRTSPIPDGLIPPPPYYGRVETLQYAQRCEYAAAFSGGRFDLVGKYLAVRLDALMRSAFVGYPDLEALITETGALIGAPGIKPSLKGVGELVLRMLRFLKGLSRSDRTWRVEKLLELDADGNPAITMTVSLSGESSISKPRRIVVTPSYIDFATAPMERIDRFMATGRDKSTEDEADDRSRNAALRQFYESDLFKLAREATLAPKKDPDLIISTVSSMLEAMYEMLSRDQDLSLDIGYWTDKVTAALVKKRHYAEALKWLDRYDSLSAELLQRTTKGPADAMRGRRLRIASIISK